ncbi:MAG: hypothetical protein ABR958_10370, partial [Dehalococcoidales bacterium]
YPRAEPVALCNSSFAARPSGGYAFTHGQSPWNPALRVYWSLPSDYPWHNSGKKALIFIQYPDFLIPIGRVSFQAFMRFVLRPDYIFKKSTG